MKRHKTVSARWLALASAGAALLLLLIGTGNALDGANAGTALFFGHVLPSTFPFLVAAGLMARALRGKAVGKTALTSMLLVGNLSGYPAGARLCGNTAAKLQRRVDRVLLLTAGIGAGPGFIVATVGAGVLGSAHAGRMLYAAQLLCAATAAVPFLVRFRKREQNSAEKETPFSFAEEFVGAVKDGCLSELMIGGYVILFSCLLGILRGFVPLDGIKDLAVSGLVEVSNGCSRASLAYGETGIALVGFLLGFGGLSVLCQLAALTQQSGVSMVDLLLSRLLAGALTGLYAWVLVRLFPFVTETAAFRRGVDVSAHHPWGLAATLVLLVVVLLLCDRKTADVRFNGS